MRSFLYLSLLFFIHFSTFASPPKNDQIKGAQELNSLTGYCSNDGEYTNVGATSSGFKKASFWGTEGKDVWYKFKAIRTDVNITVTGKTTQNSINTLISPLIAIYTYDGTRLTEMIGSMVTSNNLTTAYKGGLNVGDEYYVRISAENDHTGTFKLCINNYNPPHKAGQDCITASILCSKETFTESNIAGAGDNNKETAGTCLGTESNSAWYKWTSANNGTLTFSITPTSETDDIDWVLYDLGTSGDCSGLTAANAIRCAAGNGINCTPSYYITGLNLTSTDISEERNCPPGQDGWLKYVDMIEEHTYALLINNFSNGNNGFTLSFGGTGEFKGPKTDISLVKNNLCTPLQSFTFSANPVNSVSLKWNFGEGASMSNISGKGPYQVTYQSEGPKNVSLEATNTAGCSVFTYYNLYVAGAPAKPQITASKTKLCIDDVLKFSTPEVKNANYSWSGPNNFTSVLQNPEIKITGPQNSGDYKLVVQVGECFSEEAVLTIPRIPEKPVAAFEMDQALSTKYLAPLSVRFINKSLNSTSYLWKFGDGSTSNELHPLHVYTKPGSYEISLTAYSENDCFNTIFTGQLVILQEGSLLIPNAISPNGDGINDEFKINLPNLRTYHIMIFNRWGVKLFESKDIFNNWNGKYQGQDLPPGAYYYLINGTEFNNKTIRHSGSITLIR